MAQVTIGIAQSLLSSETEPTRFERFCCDLISKIEGDVTILTTSSNYDRGRDGVSAGGSGPKVVLLCSLTDNIDQKSLDDAKKLLKHSGVKRPDAVYFCSSQKFTEAKADKIEDKMREVLSLPAGFDRITAFSGQKIAQLSTKQDGLFETHYPSELTDILKALANSPAAEQAEHALRLALSTTAADDAATIREDVWSALLRLHLAKRQSTAAALSAAISNYLRLSSAISSSVLLTHLNNLVSKGQVEVTRGIYKLTEDGRKAFDEDEARVVAGVLTGKEAFVKAVKLHLKTDLTTDQSDRMWHSIQEELATLFYERGREVLSQVSSLISIDGEQENVDNTKPTEGFNLLSSLARAAGRAFTHSDQRKEVETAIRDIIIENESEAVRWLTRAAYAFVCACAMGIESRTSQALEEVIGKTNLIFDTDIILSFLSTDEPSHHSIVAIRERWKDLGGKILLANEVAYEVAYHAWIAQVDADHVDPVSLKTTLDRQILSRNAFVRGFARLLAEKKIKKNQWVTWIQQFRGKHRSDTSSTRRTLTRDHKFSTLPAPSGQYRELAEAIHLQQREAVSSERGGRYDEHDEFVKQDKAKRDAYLFASAVQHREVSDESDVGGTTYLLTSSSRFLSIEKEYLKNERGLVLNVPTILYLLSMSPDRSLGLTALRGFLFDEKWQDRISDFEMMALRLVKKSDELDLVWAKRPTLFNRLQDSTTRVAIERSKGRIESKVLASDAAQDWGTSTGQAQMLKKLSEALDDIATDKKAEIELAEARKEIADLKRQLAAAREQRSKKKILD